MRQDVGAVMAHDAVDCASAEHNSPCLRTRIAVREVLSTEGSVAARAGKGGTAPTRVREQIVSAKSAVEQLRTYFHASSDGTAYVSPEAIVKLHDADQA